MLRFFLPPPSRNTSAPCFWNSKPKTTNIFRSRPWSGIRSSRMRFTRRKDTDVRWVVFAACFESVARQHSQLKLTDYFRREKHRTFPTSDPELDHGSYIFFIRTHLKFKKHCFGRPFISAVVWVKKSCSLSDQCQVPGSSLLDQGKPGCCEMFLFVSGVVSSATCCCEIVSRTRLRSRRFCANNVDRRLRLDAILHCTQQAQEQCTARVADLWNVQVGRCSFWRIRDMGAERRLDFENFSKTRLFS